MTPPAMRRPTAWMASGIVLAAGLAVRAPGATRLPLNVDEPLYLVTAQVPATWLTLYRDTLFNKPALSILSYKLALLSAHPLLALWSITTLLIVATALLLSRVATRLAGDETTGLLAGLLYYAFVNRAPNGIASAQLEHPINLLIAGVMYLLVVHDVRRPWVRTMSVAAVVALALLKQYLVVFVIVLGLAAQSVSLCVIAGVAVVVAFAAHFALFHESFGNLVLFSGRYYHPEPLAGMRALAKFAGKSAGLLVGAWLVSGAWRRLPASGARKASLTRWMTRHRVSLIVLALGAITVLTTKGWPPHLLLLVPPVTVLAASAMASLCRGARGALPVIALLISVYIGYGVRETLRYSHHAAWTWQLVAERDYEMAVRMARRDGARTVYTFPAPIPEFYFDAGIAAAGFNPENDYRAAIGRSVDLQQRFREGFERNRPDLCIEIAPRRGSEGFVNPDYARFVHDLVAARGRMIADSGGVRVWDCRRGIRANLSLVTHGPLTHP